MTKKDFIKTIQTSLIDLCNDTNEEVAKVDCNTMTADEIYTVAAYLMNVASMKQTLQHTLELAKQIDTQE